MDADVDFAWISTQAVVSNDIQPDNEQEKINDYGCIVLNGMIDNGRYVLKEGDNTIGRHPLNDIYIEHPSVSMNHAVIQCDSDGVVLLDKGSLNKTKLNKKNLRKDVAYFLEENALLMFGEVQADYFINGESNEFINNTKSIASNNTSTHKETQNDGLSLSTLSNTVNVSESLQTDIPNAITDCNVSSIIENSSTCMIEKAIPQTITESKCPVNTFDDVHAELISSSPSDEYLLEALSQIETMQNNIDSNKIFQNLSNKDTLIKNTTESIPKVTREDTPSPVMDLKNSILTTNNKTISLCQSPNKINIEAIREDTPSPVMDLESSFITTNNISGSIFQSSDKINTELIREDTPSPTMDLENSFETTNNIPGRIFQTPNKINTELIREDTPSPVMDFGCYNDSENKLETNCHGIISAIQSPNKDDELNNTQVVEISNFKSENSSISMNRSLIQKQNTSMNNIFCKSQKVESGDQSNLTTTNVFDIHSNDNLSYSNNINSIKKSSVKPAEHLNGIHNDGLNNDSKKNRSMLTIPNLQSDTEGNNTNNYNINFNTFEADDDDIFSNFIENESKSQKQNLNVLENQDLFNSPTQKKTTDKNINLKSNVSNEIHKEKTQEILEFPKSGKVNLNLSTNYSTSIHEELTQIPDMDDDFFNCPTQKYAFPKKKNEKPKTSTSIHEEETQRPSELVQFNKTKTSISDMETEVLKIDNEDFFDCPTQKLSITKNTNPKPKVSSTIHEEETQVPEIHDDFFNCPTQKYAYPKKINEKKIMSSSIHEEETQMPSELVQFNKTKTSSSNTETEVFKKDNKDFFDCPTQKLSITKNTNPKPKVSSTIHEEETQVPEMHDDFFNCPTQKYAYPKKINEKPKTSSSIHEEETQRPSELVQFNKAKASSTNTETKVLKIDEDLFNFPTQKLSVTKNTNPKQKVSSTIHEEETQVPEMNDDFFNCPTQKLSVTKKINEKPKTSSSIHEEETQRPSELVQFNKTNTSSSNTETKVLKIDNEDFFDCPTQKLSITKNTNQKPKVSSTIHEKETQNIFEFSKPNKNNLTVSKDNSTSIHEEETQVPEMDDDFYNCPTQKLSVTKKIYEKPKTSSWIHEEETQRPSELVQFNKVKTSSTNTETKVLKIDNEDFFDCPTQKLSITKNTIPKSKVSSTIHEEETQNIFEFSKPNNNLTVLKNNSTSTYEEETQVPEMDDDFYNCPTQKLSIPKKINEKPKTSSSIHEEETQRLSELVRFNKTNTSSSNTETKVLKIDNEDFFNCPTQKLSITKNSNQKPKVSSTIHEKETQNILEFSKPNKNNLTVSKDNSTSIHEEETQVPEIDDDFYNCPTQKLSVSKKIVEKPKTSSSIYEEETQVTEMDDDFFNCPTQKNSIPKRINQSSNVSTIANKENSQKHLEFSKLNKINSNISKTDSTNNHKKFDECTLNNHKQTVEHDNENTDKVQKSKCVNSNIIKLSNVQLPVMCKENSSNSLKVNKPKIRVREDLCISYSSNSSNSMVLLNKPIENTVMNNINTTVPLNKNLNSPSCSKSLTDGENVLNMLSSIKQEHFSDDSAQSRVSISNKVNDRLKRMDESIFSPLNIPDISADSLSKHHSSPKTVEDNLNSLNCEPSTSNNDASIWKSFWNKKKVQSQVKGKSDKQNNITHEVKENKERYQTRAITRKENASKLNRKRKQDGDEESNKKICTRNKILEPLVENSSEIVVSFSYLKSRHLQEMKQFVDKTGGSVTDEITQCTVLVTDKIRCTMKILSAIARGCPIVNVNWLKHSYTVKMFQDANDFLIVDKDAERKYQFQLKESLAKAKTKKLLEGYNVLVTPSVKPGPQEMKVIIACAGGNYVLNWTDTQCTKELIVTCDKDRNRWKPAWDNDFAKIIDSDTLVTSIIRQKLTI